MNSGEFESPASPIKVQETANASSTVAAAAPQPSLSPINCEPSTRQSSSADNNTVDNPPDSDASKNSTIQDPMKVFAPVIVNDVNRTTSKNVPMVMVPVKDSGTLIDIPISVSHPTQIEMSPQEDVEQAKDLLNWNDDGTIGTLDGCDLRFRVNQLGCLELLDSDDESENHMRDRTLKSKYHDAISTSSIQSNNHINNHSRSSDNARVPTGVCKVTTNASATSSSTKSIASNGISNSRQNLSSGNDKAPKRIKIDPEPAPIKQISPGSSLLRDGPNIRRPKTGSNYSLTGRGQSNSLSLLKKLEQNQNSLLVEKLVPKQRLDEIKTNVTNWSTEDVRKFVDSIPGCSGNGELFVSQQICGKSLMHLDQRDLLDVINVKLGPAVKIYHAISLLK